MNKKITLVFPGQGSQYVGMGKNISPAIFAEADEALGFSLSHLCLEGPMEDLKKTMNTQPAIVTHSFGLWKKIEPILKEMSVEVEHVLGHSVGEYSALAAAGAISFSDAVKLVQKRGSFMQAAVPEGKGKMVAILKLDEQIIINACQEASKPGAEVMPANFNDPTQTVISGTIAGCDRAIEILTEKIEGRLRAIPLKVSAPFHCQLMTPAAEKLDVQISHIKMNPLNFPYIANIDAQIYGRETTQEKIKKNLVDQVCGSVLWTKSIALLPDNSLVAEVGPGKVLTGLIKKINPTLNVVTLDSENGIEDLKEALA